MDSSLSQIVPLTADFLIQDPLMIRKSFPVLPIATVTYFSFTFATHHCSRSLHRRFVSVCLRSRRSLFCEPAGTSFLCSLSALEVSEIH